MRFELHIGVDNAAFVDDEETFDPAPELARILSDLAERIEAGELRWPDEPIRLSDFNGNRVGFAVLTEEAP